MLYYRTVNPLLSVQTRIKTPASIPLYRLLGVARFASYYRNGIAVMTTSVTYCHKPHLFLQSLPHSQSFAIISSNDILSTAFSQDCLFGDAHTTRGFTVLTQNVILRQLLHLFSQSLTAHVAQTTSLQRDYNNYCSPFAVFVIATSPAQTVCCYQFMQE